MLSDSLISGLPHLFSPHIALILLIIFTGFFPGWVLSLFLGPQLNKENPIIWSHIFSLLVFCLCLIAIAALNINTEVFFNHYFFFWVIVLLFYLAFCFFIKKTNKKQHISCLKMDPFLIIIFMAVLLYIYVIGIYDLVPSDILRHMERIQFAARDIKNHQINDAHLYDGISDYYHYYFYAYLMVFSGIDIHGLAKIITVINTTFLLSAIRLLITHLLQADNNINTNTIHKKWLTLLCTMLGVILFIFTKGIANFSFIRYYSLAPTILSYAVFILLLINIDRLFKRQWHYLNIILILLGSVFLLLWHWQEWLFLTLYCLLFAIYWLYKQRFDTRQRPSFLPLEITSTIPFTVLLLSLITASFFYIQHYFPLPTHLSHRVVSLQTLLNLLLPNTSESSTYFSNFYLLNPFYQLFQVFGLWGIVVYVCAILNIKTMAKQPLLLIGLLIPFVTVFNPIFTDVFLRVRGEDTLYRFLYATPLAMTAAYLLFHSFHTIFYASDTYKKTKALFISSMLFLALIPFKSNTQLTQYSRIDDVFSVDKKQSLRYWRDLIDVLQTLPENHNILTDPVTGYIITATTQNIAKRYKFTMQQHMNLNDIEFSKPFFDNQKDNLVIINLRDGSLSKLGKISTHWQENILKVSRYYSPKLITDIKEKPNHFKLLWQKNHVSIYQIQ